MYGGATYTNINKLRYDTFLKKYQDRNNVLNVSNGTDMSSIMSLRTWDAHKEGELPRVHMGTRPWK